MRNLLERDHALPSLALSDVIEDRYAPRRLHDSAIAGEVGQHRRHAALGHAAVLGTVGTIESTGVVERRHFLVARRWWSVLPSGACCVALLAGFRCLQ